MTKNVEKVDEYSNPFACVITHLRDMGESLEESGVVSSLLKSAPK